MTSALLCSGARAAPPVLRELNMAAQPPLAACERCRDGDWLVHTGTLDVVIGTSHRRDRSFYRFPTADALGSIVYLRPSGTEMRGDIMLGTPYLRVGNTTRHVAYERISERQSGDALTITAQGAGRGERGGQLRFVGQYTFSADSARIDVSLQVTNTGAQPVRDLVYSLYFDPHQIYDFSPADDPAHAGLTFRGYPREGRLLGWLDRSARLSNDYNHSGWDGGLILPDPLAVSLLPGASDTRNYTLFAGDDLAVLRDVYRDLEAAARTVTLRPVSESTDYMELVVRDAATAAIFYRSFLDRPAPLSLALPDGRYRVQANFFPGVAQCMLEVGRGAADDCLLTDPPQGELRVRLLDSNGARVPGKVTFEGLGETATPYFRPVNPARDDGYWESHRNSVFPVLADLTVTLPAGDYRVSASRGPEFSLAQQRVQVTAGQSRPLTLEIDRVLERPDLVAMDSHLHTLESDGAVDIAQKIRALVAAGIDLAIATDHNYPVDYRPALERLGLADRLVVLSGAEVTVPERLDYNTYPMSVHAGEHNHGAIDALSTDLRSRFDASRKRDAGVILQINHPRNWQFDYFDWHHLDPVSAAFADQGFDLSFDVLEVVNGAIYDTDNNEATRRDWFNLLRRGYFFPLVGSSDSHEIDRDEPGYSRTWVYRGDAARAPLDADAILAQLRKGHSFASNGPLLDLTIDGKYRPGDTARAVGGVVRGTVDVWSPPWMEASQVRLYVNGVPQALAVAWVADAAARHWRAAFELNRQQDAYLVAEVRGTQDLHPVIQRRRTAGGPPVPVLPYALTNPVFIDVDGNGRFDAPLPRHIELRPAGR